MKDVKIKIKGNGFNIPEGFNIHNAKIEAHYMKKDVLTELEELAKKATPGPWISCSSYFNVGPTQKSWIRVFYLIGPALRAIFHTENIESPENDGDYIAKANPQTILTLITCLRKAMGALEYFSSPDQVGSITNVDIFNKTITIGETKEVYSLTADVCNQTLKEIEEELEKLNG